MTEDNDDEIEVHTFKDFYSFLLEFGNICWGESYFINHNDDPQFISGDA